MGGGCVGTMQRLEPSMLMWLAVGNVSKEERMQAGAGGARLGTGPDQARKLRVQAAEVLVPTNMDGLVAVKDKQVDLRRIAQLLRSGHLKKLARGQYIDSARWQRMHRTDRFRHFVLAVVSNETRGVITGAAALALHGTWVMTRGAKIRVIGGGQAFEAVAQANRVKEHLAPEHIATANGRRVTSLAKAAFDECRARASRMRRPADLRAAVVAIEGVMQRGVTHADLASVAMEYPNLRGRNHFKHAMRLSSGLCESPGEAMSKVALVEAGFSFQGKQGGKYSFYEQVVISSGKGHGKPAEQIARVDFYVPELALAIEFDGAAKYERGEIAPDADAQRELMTAEIWRERSLRAVGVDIVRLEWRDVLNESWHFKEKIAKVVEARERAIKSGAVRITALVSKPVPLGHVHLDFD